MASGQDMVSEHFPNILVNRKGVLENRRSGAEDLLVTAGAGSPKDCGWRVPLPCCAERSFTRPKVLLGDASVGLGL